jgi:hypothetical protein
LVQDGSKNEASWVSPVSTPDLNLSGESSKPMEYQVMVVATVMVMMMIMMMMMLMMMLMMVKTTIVS